LKIFFISNNTLYPINNIIFVISILLSNSGFTVIYYTINSIDKAKYIKTLSIRKSFIYNYFLDGIIDENLAYVYIEGNWYKLLGINYAILDLIKFEDYKKCYEELSEYDECYVKSSGISDDVLQKSCEVYKSEKCKTYFSDPLESVPSCAEAMDYKSIPQLTNIDDTLSNIHTACGIKEDYTTTYNSDVEIPSDEEIEKIVQKCYDELHVYYECYITYVDIPEDELQKNCKVYQSEKCQKYFKDPLKYVPSCSEAIGYRSVSALNDMDRTITDFNKACGVSK